MAVDGYLNFKTKIDSKGFNAGTKQIGEGLMNVKQKLGKVGAAVGAAFSVKALVDFGKSAIETASDLQEVQNVVDVSFGELGYKMEAFADKAIESFGISELAAKKTGSTFMAMAKGMDVAEGAASDMAISLTGLSADMASFYNVDQETAATALKSVFTGETETLKQFGIVMNETNLKAFALSQGITKSYDSMTQAEKVQLRYAYVMKQTALAQGDFARTSDGWANQTRMLSQKWKEFSGIIGTALVQTLLPAVRTINAALDKLISAAKAAVEALAKVFGWEIESNDSEEKAKAQADAIAQSVDNQEELTEETKKTNKAANDNLQSFDRINKLQADSKDSKEDGGIFTLPTESKYTIDLDANTKKAQKEIDDFSKKFKNTINPLISWYKKNFSKKVFARIFEGLSDEFDELRQTFSGIVSDLQTLAEPLKTYFNTDFTEFLQTFCSASGDILVGLFDSFNMVFSDIWNVAVFPVISSFINEALPMITQFASHAVGTLGTYFNSIKEIFDKLWSEGVKPTLEAIVQIWNDCISSLRGAWDKWGAPIFENLRTAITKTKELILEWWDKYLKPLFDTVITAAKDLWNNHLKPLVDNILDFIGELVNGALEIYNKFIQPVLSWFIDKFGPQISKLFSNLVAHIKACIGNIVDYINGIITVLKGVIQFITGVFTGDWDKAWTGIKNIFGGIFDSISAYIKTPINGIIGAINRVLSAICTAVNVAIRAINKISVDLPEWAGGYHIGFDFAEITPPQIPYLAKGTVVPANYGEFLAVLGDNKRETEVVSPLSTIEKALENVMSRHSGQGQDINLKVYLDGDVVYQNVVKHNRNAKKSMGVNPLAV